jgi:polar amino acid transport system substrate-binding protein
VDTIAAEVPEAIRRRGTLIVTGDANSAPPLRFYADDDKTMIGIETDFAYLVADILGLRVDLRSADWAQNFVKVDSGEVDAFISNVTVTEERKDKFDFATYRLDNVAFEVRRSLDWKVKGARDIAGKTIGVGSGTNQEALLVQWNEQNVAAGLPAADLKYFQQTTGYYLALASGRIDAYVGPNPTAVFHSQATGQTKLVGTFSGAGEALQGEIAVLIKKDNGLVRAVADAINHAIADGTYRKVLQRWGLENEAVAKSEINPRGLPRQG